MPIVPQRTVCRAPNAFNVEAYVSRIFPILPCSRHVRWFATSGSSFQNVAEQINHDQEVPKDLSSDRHPLVKIVKDDNWKYYHRLRPSKKYEKRLQASLDPSSLRKTLENHRAMNMDFLIRRGNTETPPGFAPHRELGLDERKEHTEEIEEQVRNEIDNLFENPNDMWFEHLNLEHDDVAGGGDKAEKIVRAKERGRSVPALEYEGQYVTPVAHQSQQYRIPWLVNEHVRSPERLDMEIDRFWQYIQLTDTERAAHSAVLQQTLELIQRLQPDYKSETFGSRKTGLVLATSDLDIRFYDENINPDTDVKMAPRHLYRKKLFKALRALHSVLDTDPNYMICFLRQARFPLISMQHKESGIDIQIVCANDTSHQQEFVQKYLAEYKDLPSLFAALKTMFDIRGLMDVYRGGLGSYNLFMMIVASLKLWGHPIAVDGRGDPLKAKERYGSLKDSTVGGKLRHFLHFYSVFNPYWNMITIEPPRVNRKVLVDEKIPKRELEKMKKYPEVNGRYKIGIVDQSQPYLLCLQDPADPLNDLGRKAYGIKHIQATITHLHQQLESRLGERNKSHNHLLELLLGPSSAIYEGRRKKMEEYGSKLL